MAGAAGPMAGAAVWGTAPTGHSECCCRAGAPWGGGALVGIGVGVRVSAGLWVTAGDTGHPCSRGWWHWASQASGQLL